MEPSGWGKPLKKSKEPVKEATEPAPTTSTPTTNTNSNTNPGKS